MDEPLKIKRSKESSVSWTIKKQEALEAACALISLISKTTYDTEMEKKASDWLRTNRAYVLL
jgi:hypothetical protein